MTCIVYIRIRVGSVLPLDLVTSVPSRRLGASWVEKSILHHVYTFKDGAFAGTAEYSARSEFDD